MPHSTLMESELRHRFLSLWKECSKHVDKQVNPEIVWDLLIQHYSSKNRHYHNFNHILHCCKEMDLVEDYIDDPHAVFMAIVFHDVICIPLAADNEIRSANVFETIHRSSFDEGFIQRVKQLILSTTFGYIPIVNDEKIIRDIDLSSFALPWELFVKDCLAVRAEHVNEGDRVFYPGKLKFLNSLLGRPRIFISDFFHQRYEARARTNISQYIQYLHDQGHI